MLISTEKEKKRKVGTTNSEAVVSIISIELRVVKSVILQKVQTKSTISKSLIKIEPVFESGNKNLENEHRCRTGKTNVHFKSSGMLGWGGVKNAHYQFIFHLFWDHNMTRPTVFTYPENAHEAEVNTQYTIQV